MATRDLEAIYSRINELEQDRVRADVEHTVMRTKIHELTERLVGLETWQIDMKVLVAKAVVLYGGLSLLGQCIITVIVQLALHKMTK